MCDFIIDIHAHILPGVDDGSRTIEESVEMAVMAARQGITAMIATPHYSRKRRENRFREIYEETRKRIREAVPDFSLYLGQELYYHADLEEDLLSGRALTLAGTRYILVEFDPRSSYSQISRAVRSLSGFGYVPVIAHIERYGSLREEGLLENLHKLGALFQMNYESLSGGWYNRDVRWCRRQVKEETVHFLGTDMHRTDYRPPAIKDAIAWIGRHVNRSYAEKITGGNAARLLRDCETK